MTPKNTPLEKRLVRNTKAISKIKLPKIRSVIPAKVEIHTDKSMDVCLRDKWIVIFVGQPNRRRIEVDQQKLAFLIHLTKIAEFKRFESYLAKGLLEKCWHNSYQTQTYIYLTLNVETYYWCHH